MSDHVTMSFDGSPAVAALLAAILDVAHPGGHLEWSWNADTGALEMAYFRAGERLVAAVAVEQGRYATDTGASLSTETMLALATTALAEEFRKDGKLKGGR